MIAYPESVEGIPNELEAHRLVVSEALDRPVAIEEIWPELKAVGHPQIESPFWVCAPFSSGLEKDFPLNRWVELFLAVQTKGNLPTLVLTGSPDQKDRLREFRQLIAVVSPELADKVRIIIPANLQNLIDLLAAAECVTTVDTAAAHAATALDCRTLVLFSGKHQGMFAPWVRSSRQRWLLPKPSLSSLPWYETRETVEILHSLEAILGA